jgi:lipid-binding SYLF domain-containing protein
MTYGVQISSRWLVLNQQRRSYSCAMERILVALSLLAAILTIGCSQHHLPSPASDKTMYDEQAQIVERLRDAGTDLKELMNAPDSTIPAEVLANAKCVAVVPNMVKGGFVIGANHGRGVATCRIGNGWSQPGFFAITGGTWGAQIGLESVDLVMVFLGDAGMQQLLQSQFKLGADAGVAAGPVGREAQASTDWTMKNKILVYSRTKGLFAGINLSGASVRPDDDSARTYYGQAVPANLILTGRGPSNPHSTQFLANIREAFHEAKASGGQDQEYIPARQFISQKYSAPDGFGAYGYVVFTKRPSLSERKRYQSLCHSYIDNLEPASEFSSKMSRSLMMTFWPMQQEKLSGSSRCDLLIDGYGYALGARIASSVGKSGAAGPLLVAWPKAYGNNPSGTALVFDLSDFDDSDLDRAMHIWKDQISENPALWNRGFDLIKCREAARNLIQRYGEQIVVLIQARGYGDANSSKPK